MTAPIAIVEDNEDLRTELVFHLECAGYSATGLPHGIALEHHLAHQPCRLVLLDLGLPGEEGLSICQRLRATRPELGVVILTARAMARDRLSGLQGGADAYLVKPTPPEELLAVIANLLRRLPAIGLAAQAVGDRSWVYCSRTVELTAPNGRAVPLTHAEGRLLEALLLRAPRPARRRELVEALGGRYLDFAEHRLEVAISRLRRKIMQAMPGAEPIRAARGIGYLLTIACVRQA